jgi:hypothetical protein
MGDVVPIKKGKDYTVISQDELFKLYKLQQAFLDAQSAYLSERAKIVERLSKNAHQEPGQYYLEGVGLLK